MMNWNIIFLKQPTTMIADQMKTIIWFSREIDL